MAQTNIPFGDVKAQKHWSAMLMQDVVKTSYFTRKFMGKGDNYVIEQKTELEASRGDRISFDLAVRLRGAPTRGDNRLEGNEENLRFYTDEVIVDQMRKSANAGGEMTRQRTAHDLRSIARKKLAEYWARYMDELMFVYLSGARGINQDFVEDPTYTGHAGNPVQAPDAQHIIYGGDAVSKATLDSADIMKIATVEKAVTTARMMNALDPDATNMVPVNIEGENHYVIVMSPLQEHSLRTADTTGWIDVQKAAAGAEGRKNPIFKGGLGMINKVVLHSHESVIRFSDYGAGSNVLAARALFMGRQAGVIAFGSKSGMKFTWKEEWKDYGNEPVVASGTICGIKKTRFRNRDFGVLAIDTYAPMPA